MSDEAVELAPGYPPERYHGETGEQTARFRRAAGAAPEISRPSVDITYVASSSSTDGEIGVYRTDFRPREASYNPGVSNIHFHKTLSESLYVLDGTIQFYDGREWHAAVPGDYLYVPVGGIHAFQHVDDEPASMLMMFTPGAPREAYFEGMRDVTPEQFLAFSLAHDTYRIDPA